MAITSQLIGAIGGGGGKPFAATFTGSDTLTRTVGESGKTYLVFATNFPDGTSSTKVTVNGTLLTKGIDAATLNPQGMLAAPGPVTIFYKGAAATAMATVVVTEATAF